MAYRKQCLIADEEEIIMNLIQKGLGGGAIAVLIIAVACCVPMVFLWCINSLSEAGGSSFYIEHNPFNYLLAFVAVAIVRGGNS